MWLAVYLIFFFSGVAGLIYEVSWTRQVGLLFGQTVQSAAVVLSCYFLGTAVGYWLAGRLARSMRPLYSYAIAEVAVGLWALMIPLILRQTKLSAVAEILNAEPYWLQLMVRSLFVFLLLLPSTVALGATLPFMAEHFIAKGSGTRAVALAYAVNVAGAFVGVVFGTMYLILSFGVVGSSYVAVGVSFLCAAGAVQIGKGTDSSRAPVFGKTQRLSWRDAIHSRWTWLALISGYGILALQVLYMRLFSLVLHNSVYSFGAVVAVFLVAMTGASAFVARHAKRFDATQGLVVVFQSGGLAVACSVLGFILWTGLEYFEFGKGFYHYLLGVFGFATVVMIVPVGIVGVALPWIWVAAADDKGSSAMIGALTSANAIGAGLGSLAASFLLLPMFGLWGSFVAIATSYVLVGAILCGPRASRGSLATTGAALIFCVVSYFAAQGYRGRGVDDRLLARWESAYGWIDVIEVAKSKAMQLRQNIHYGLGSTTSITMERRQAHIPLLLHPNPRDVLFIGLATGITAGAALDHPSARSVDIVELIPDVVRGAALFDEFNRGVTKADKVKIVVNDGRHFLYAGEKRYDVIVADLFVPWESHTGYLYTTENYKAARRRLKSGGLFCQWLPLWQLGERELRLIADSFASVFPKVTVWYGRIHEHWTIVGLLGTEEMLTVDSANTASRLVETPPKISKDRSWFEAPSELFSLYAGDWLYRSGTVLNTDEHPRVEFYTPVTAWTKGARLRFDALRDFQANVLGRLPASHAAYFPRAGEVAASLDQMRESQKGRMHESGDLEPTDEE